jgi:drug/metabolite transporter (DMT)-like permease
MLRNLNKKAVLFFIFAWFNFSIMEVTAKYLSFKYPINEVIWIRFFSQTIVLFLIFFPFIKTKLVTHSLYLHISRGVCLFFAALFFFIGFTKTDLANATAIYKTSPIFLTLSFSRLLIEWHIAFCNVLNQLLVRSLFICKFILD